MKKKINAEKMILAFADLTRIRLIRLFCTSSVELCLCDVAESLREPTPNLSRHLKVLRETEILTAYKEGRWLFHQLNLKKPHLVLLYEMVLEMPDDSRDFARDKQRLKNLLSKRAFTKCVSTSVNPNTKKPTELRRK